MSSYLLNYKGKYYFRIWVPLDVRQHFSSAEIKRSLHTSNLKLAKSQANLWLGKAEQVFVTLRSNVLESEHISVYINSILPSPRQQKVRVEKKEKQRLQRKGKRLMQVVQEYNNEHVTMGKWSEKTICEVRGQLNLLVNVLGDVSLDEIDRNIMVGYLETLKKLPAGINKSPTYRGKTIKEILAMPGIEPMSTTTINKYIERAGSLLIWCMKHEYITRNPAMGLSVTKTVREDDQRAAYGLEDIVKIKAHLKEAAKGNETRYWIPMIGMYSGMRLNEIAQLYCTDIVRTDGVWCFDINESEDKRVKNMTSKRQVPIHSKLIELGLLDYVERLKNQNHPRLWMDLVLRRDGYSHDIGHWYSRYNRRHITEDPKKCFHSFRHLVCDTLKQAGVEVSVISELVGHAHKGSITLSRYGKRYRPQILLDALMKLDY